MKCWNCKQDKHTTKIALIGDLWDVCADCNAKIMARSKLAKDKMKRFIDRYKEVANINDSVHIRLIRGTSKKDQKDFDEYIVGYPLGQLEQFALWDAMKYAYNLCVGLTNWNVCFRNGKRTVRYGTTEYFAVKFSKC